MNIKKIIGFTIGPVGSSALGLVTVPVIAWLFSAEDIGRIAVLQVVMSCAVLLFSLGLDQAYVRDYHGSVDKSALLKTSTLPGITALSITLLLILAFPGLLSKLLFDVESNLISCLIAIYLFSGLISRFTSIIFRMKEQGLSFSMSQIIPKILLLIIISCYAALSFGLNLFYLIVANVISFAAAAVFFTYKAKAEWKLAYNSRFETNKIKPMLLFGLPLIISGLSYWGLTAMNTIFMRNSSTFDQLAIYSVAISFASVGGVFRSIFSTIWAPTVYKWEHEGIAVKKISNTTDQVVLSIALLFCIIAIFSFVASYILPEKYDNVQFILVSCMAYPLFYTLSEATGIGSGIMRRSSHSLFSSVLTLLINFVAIYYLVPLLGATGAAISTAVSSWLYLVIRTEMSAYAWRQIPRVKMYVTTLGCLVMSISYTYKGSEFPVLFTAAWGTFLVILLISYKTTIYSVISNTTTK